MGLFLIGFNIQSEAIPGYVANGVTVSVQKDKSVVHIFFSKAQARAIHAMHSSVGNKLELFHEMISKCVLPEESEKEMLVLDGVVASELTEVFFDTQSAPEDFEKPLGIFDINGPDYVSDEEPYVVVSVNETKERTSVHVIASLNQFNEVIASCEALMNQESVISLLSLLHEMGLPQSSSKRALLIDGFAAQIFGSGFNMRCYRTYLENKKEQERLALERAKLDEQRLYRILACHVISADIAKKAHTFMLGFLIFQDAAGYKCITFYSKHQGIAFTLEAHDFQAESIVLEAIQSSDLPLTSLVAPLIVDGNVATILVAAYRAHDAADVSEEERTFYVQMKPHISNMYFSRATESSPFALISVMLSHDEQFLYICKSKAQVLLLYKKYSKLFSKNFLAEAKKTLNSTTLPETSDQPTVSIEGLFARVCIRGLRILTHRQNAN